MTYNDLVARLLVTAGIDVGSDVDWPTALPNIIELAEARCYRDVDFLTARRSITVALTPSAATLAAGGDWLLGQDVTLVVAGGFVLLDRRDVSYLRDYAPFGAATGQPRYWCEPTAGTLQFAPVPDLAYTAVLDYHARPVPLSASNPFTWLATNAPDLLFAACMVQMAAYQKNFGAQADDPRQAMSWEAMYKVALDSVLNEEGRRKGDNTFDSSRAPPPSSNLPPAPRGP